MKDINKLRAYAMQSIKKAGLPAPVRLPEITKSQQFPSNMTDLSPEQVRSQMSYWTAQAGRAGHELALAETDVIHVKNLIDQHSRFAKATSKHREVWKVEAELEQDEEYLKLKERLQRAKAVTTLLRTTKDRFESYYEALSRELTARLSEYDRASRGSDG